MKKRVEGEVVGNGGNSPIYNKEGKMPSCYKRKIVIIAAPENPALTRDSSESLSLISPFGKHSFHLFTRGVN